MPEPSIQLAVVGFFVCALAPSACAGSSSLELEPEAPPVVGTAADLERDPRPTRRPKPATASPAPLRTWTPRPTKTATPTDPPITPEAVLALEAAERIVLGWLDAKRSPRIESSAYVVEPQLLDALPDSGLYDWCAPGEMRLGIGHSRRFPDEHSTSLLIVVQASTAGMDLLHQAGQHAGQRPSASNANVVEPDLCVPVPSFRRQHVVAIFDAASGEQLCASLGHERLRLAVSRLVAEGRKSLPLARWLATATPARTASPQAAPELDPARRPRPADLPQDASMLQPLGRGEVPASLVPAMKEHPLLVGSRWRYERSGHSNGIRWWSDQAEESVEAAWLIKPDVMLVAMASGRQLYVFPEGSLANLQGQSLETARAKLRGTPAPGATPVPWPHRPFEAIRYPLRAPETVDYWREMQRVDALDTPAGRFSECYLIREVMSAPTSQAQWLCRGIGFARRDLPGCSSMYGGHVVELLAHYEIPEFLVVAARPGEFPLPGLAPRRAWGAPR